MGTLKRKSQRNLNLALDGAYSDLFAAVHDGQIDLCFHGLATDPPVIDSIQVKQIDPLAYDSATLGDGFVLVNYGRFSCVSEQMGPGFSADDNYMVVNGSPIRRSGGIEIAKMGFREVTVVCVTGASGRLHSFLDRQALAPLRLHRQSHCDPKKTYHLLGLEGAKERLHLFKADLLEEGSFDSVVDGCVGGFHTATHVLFSYADPMV